MGKPTKTSVVRGAVPRKPIDYYQRAGYQINAEWILHRISKHGSSAEEEPERKSIVVEAKGAPFAVMVENGRLLSLMITIARKQLERRLKTLNNVGTYPRTSPSEAQAFALHVFGYFKNDTASESEEHSIRMGVVGKLKLLEDHLWDKNATNGAVAETTKRVVRHLLDAFIILDLGERDHDILLPLLIQLPVYLSGDNMSKTEESGTWRDEAEQIDKQDTHGERHQGPVFLWMAHMYAHLKQKKAGEASQHLVARYNAFKTEFAQQSTAGLYSGPAEAFDQAVNFAVNPGAVRKKLMSISAGYNKLSAINLEKHINSLFHDQSSSSETSSLVAGGFRDRGFNPRSGESQGQGGERSSVGGSTSNVVGSPGLSSSDEDRDDLYELPLPDEFGYLSNSEAYDFSDGD